MQAILGIDAAWTPGEPSGVALVGRTAGSWRVACVAPSYEQFLSACRGRAVDWAQRPRGSAPDVAGLVDAAKRRVSGNVTVVAVDMPIAKVPFESRRIADNEVSRAFGGLGCSAHSPNARRPGPFGANIMRQLSDAGFLLATTGSDVGFAGCTIEVYPHPALLSLLHRTYRVPYKVSRSGRYWRGASRAERIASLVREFRTISVALSGVFGDLGFAIPEPHEVPTLSYLKRYEDALDGLVCAWVGLCFLRGEARPLGDESAAVWVPSGSLAVVSNRR